MSATGGYSPSTGSWRSAKLLLHGVSFFIPVCWFSCFLFTHLCTSVHATLMDTLRMRCMCRVSETSSKHRSSSHRPPTPRLLVLLSPVHFLYCSVHMTIVAALHEIRLFFGCSVLDITVGVLLLVLTYYTWSVQKKNRFLLSHRGP